MKLAIVGSRDYPNMDHVRDFVGQLSPGTTVVSGGAQGVDSIAVFCARARELSTVVIKADWAKEGRAAGFLRNKLIVDEAQGVVAFWDGESRGTRHTIDLAKAAGKLWKVFTPVALDIPGTEAYVLKARG